MTSASHAAFVVLVVLTGASAGLAVVAFVLHGAAGWAERRRAERWVRWEPVLLEALAGGGGGTFAASVRPRERSDAFELLVTYALRLNGDSLAALAGAAAPLLRHARSALSARRADRRAFAVRLLGFLGTEADRDALAKALHDPSRDVAMAAARALARAQDARYADVLVAAVDRFSARGTSATASMLKLCGLPGAAAMARAFADPNAPEATRTACAEALRRLGYLPVVAVAVDVAADEAAATDLRAAALRLLRDVGGPGQAWAVRPLLESGHDVVRLHAVSALASISQDPGDAARIEHAVGDRSSWVALRAARGLLESGRVASLHALAVADDARGGVARQALAEAGLVPAAP